MYNLADTSFIIPLRIDHQSRLKNLELLIGHLHKYFECSILVCESDKERKLPEIKEIEYYFIEDNNAYFHRTKILNYLISKTKTPLIVNQDADVFVKPEKLVEAADKIRCGNYDVVFPYDGTSINVECQDIKKVLETYTPIVKENYYYFWDDDIPKWNDSCVMSTFSKGGIFVISKEKYIEAGGENENFISWGWEDNERWTRFEKLGYKIGRTDNELFHMDHFRGENSGNPSCLYEEHNKNQYEITKNSDIKSIIKILRDKWMSLY